MASIEIHNRIYGTNVMLATTSRISAKWKAGKIKMASYQATTPPCLAGFANN
jgi:hypothetical protein